MKSYPTNQIRNLAVIGHGDAGKTQLTSSLLYVAGATPRWGKVDEGTTTTDYDEDSIARKVTLNTALAHLEWRDHKVNLIDTPGYAAFVSHARPALRAADCALVVVHAVKGVEVQTEKTWAYANEFITPRIMVINQMDKEHADFGTALDSARHTFSRAIVPFTLPIGKEHNFRGVVDIVHMKAYEFDANGKAKEIDIPAEGREIVDKERERLVEVIAESDDKLMEKYFELGTLPEEDVVPNISRAIAASRLCPVFAVSSATLVGVSNLLDGILDYAPAPDTHEAEHGKTVAGRRRRRGRHARLQPGGAFLGLRLPHHRRPVRRSHQRDEGRQRQGQVRRRRPEHARAASPSASARSTRCRASSSTRSTRRARATSSPASSSRRRRPATRSRTRPRPSSTTPSNTRRPPSPSPSSRSRGRTKRRSASRSTRFSKKTPRSASRATRRPRSSCSPAPASSTSRPWSRN